MHSRAAHILLCCRPDNSCAVAIDTVVECRRNLNSNGGTGQKSIYALGWCRSTRPGLKDSCGKDEVAHAVDTDTCDGNGWVEETDSGLGHKWVLEHELGSDVGCELGIRN